MFGIFYLQVDEIEKIQELKTKCITFIYLILDIILQVCILGTLGVTLGPSWTAPPPLPKSDKICKIHIKLFKFLIRLIIDDGIISVDVLI